MSFQFMNQSVAFSIVVPVKDEADNLPGLIDEIAATLAGRQFEVIVVDDGSSDATPAVVRQLARSYRFIRCCVHQRTCGKSAAILTGVRAARADLIVTIDGDGQNDPRYVGPLLTLVAEPNVGLAAGQRVKHAHSWAKSIGSRFANRLRSSLLKDDTRDTACGLKAFRKQVFLRLPYFDTMHRFLPALVLREGLDVRHLEVTDRERLHGSSKYGIIDRACAGALDLVGVWWLIRRRRHLPEPREMSLDAHNLRADGDRRADR